MRYQQILVESVTKRPWTFYHGSNSAAFQQFDASQAAKGEQYWNPLGNGMYVTNNPRFASNFGSHVYKVVIPPGSSYRRINLKTWQWQTGIGLVMRALRAAFKKVGDKIEHWIKGEPVVSMSDIKKLPRDKTIDLLVAEYPGREEEVRARAVQHTDDQLRDFLRERWKYRQPRNFDKAKSDAVEKFRLDCWHTLERNDPYTGLYESHALAHMLLPHHIADAYADVLPIVTTKMLGKWDFVVFTDTNDPLMFTDTETTWEVVIFNPALQKTEPIDREEWRALQQNPF